MYSFSYLEPVCCSMSSSNCCFLTCIQVSQEASQVVWYAHLLQQTIYIYIYIYIYILNKYINLYASFRISQWKKTTVDVLKDFEVMIHIAKLTCKIVSNLLPSSLMNNRYYLLKVLTIWWMKIWTYFKVCFPDF